MGVAEDAGGEGEVELGTGVVEGERLGGSLCGGVDPGDGEGLGLGREEERGGSSETVSSAGGVEEDGELEGGFRRVDVRERHCCNAAADTVRYGDEPGSYPIREAFGNKSKLLIIENKRDRFVYIKPKQNNNKLMYFYF